jgi:hypothetical protein
VESVTLKVSEVAFAAAVGVPLIRPVDEFRVSPAGSVPDVSVHVYGAVPPVTANVCEYAVPSWPLGSDNVVIVSVVIVSVKLTLAVCAGEPESVTLKVSEVAFAAAVGVPLIRPVDEFSVSPAGNVPKVSVHVYGVVPPVAVNDCEYDVPTRPLGSDAVVIVSGAVTEAVRLKDCDAD